MLKFTNNNLNELRTDLINALATVQQKHNIIIDLGNMRYTNDTVGMKLSATIKKEGVENADDARELKLKEDFKKYANMFGFKMNDLNKEFVSNSKVFTIVGLDVKKRKYPVIALNNGKRYKFAADLVIEKLQKPS